MGFYDPREDIGGFPAWRLRGESQPVLFHQNGWNIAIYPEPAGGGGGYMFVQDSASFPTEIKGTWETLDSAGQYVKDPGECAPSFIQFLAG